MFAQKTNEVCHCVQSAESQNRRSCLLLKGEVRLTRPWLPFIKAVIINLAKPPNIFYLKVCMAIKMCRQYAIQHETTVESMLVPRIGDEKRLVHQLEYARCICNKEPC